MVCTVEPLSVSEAALRKFHQNSGVPPVRSEGSHRRDAAAMPLASRAIGLVPLLSRVTVLRPATVQVLELLPATKLENTWPLAVRRVTVFAEASDRVISMRLSALPTAVGMSMVRLPLGALT